MPRKNKKARRIVCASKKLKARKLFQKLQKEKSSSKTTPKGRD